LVEERRNWKMPAIQIHLEDAETAALDRYRREQSNPPSRPVAVREIIRRTLLDGKPVDAIVRDDARKESAA
jgi:hypothetical protein